MRCLLDLFCGAGGAAMGYHHAGFEVVGVDIKPQPRFPFAFIQADALNLEPSFLREFDAIHASPPCQAYSRLRRLPWLRGKQYPELIDPTRALLRSAHVPYVIENVSGAPLFGAELCGAALGLPLIRHRRFESNICLLFPSCPGHAVMQSDRAQMNKKYRGPGLSLQISRESIAGHFSNRERAQKAMEIDWMIGYELTQAIPPAYTEYIGRQLIAYCGDNERPKL